MAQLEASRSRISVGSALIAVTETLMSSEYCPAVLVRETSNTCAFGSFDTPDASATRDGLRSRVRLRAFSWHPHSHPLSSVLGRTSRYLAVPVALLSC